MPLCVEGFVIEFLDDQLTISVEHSKLSDQTFAIVCPKSATTIP